MKEKMAEIDAEMKVTEDHKVEKKWAEGREVRVRRRRAGARVAAQGARVCAACARRWAAGATSGATSATR